jgi:hypothetical protein
MITDSKFCSHHVCTKGSDVFSNTLAVSFGFLLIIALTKIKHIRDALGKLRKAFEILVGSPLMSDRHKND